VVALETTLGVVLCLLGVSLIYISLGPVVAKYARLCACLFVGIMLCLFAASVAFNGASFTGANLHPAPPPIPTGNP
jgi:hypothetical protein